MAVEEYLPVKWPERFFVIYCDTSKSEHSDGDRFQADVEKWIDYPITKIKSDKYESVDEVFERERYMSGIAGAKCTTEMKKVPRLNFQQADDLHIFGYTVDEPKRITDFEKANPELFLDWILRDNFIRKTDCYRIVRQAGIKLPEMYELGFEHNNCWGCVKATSPGYWNRVRKYNPEVFERRARVGDLRKAIEGVDDEMIVLLRVNNEDGDEQFMCSPSDAMPDPGCGEVEMLIIDGTDGECEHGVQANECKERHADDYEDDESQPNA